MPAHHIPLYLVIKPRKIGAQRMTHMQTNQRATAITRLGRYEIRLKGHLDARWAAWFDGLSLTRESDGTTVIRGPVVDQAALHGLLSKVRDLGLPLIAVTQVDPDRRTWTGCTTRTPITSVDGQAVRQHLDKGDTQMKTTSREPHPLGTVYQRWWPGMSFSRSLQPIHPPQRRFRRSPPAPGPSSTP